MTAEQDLQTARPQEDNHREIWPSRTGFVLAAMGSAIGLGNVWRFPYYCYRYGGGAFLIPYFIALFTTGIPLMILEYNVGQKYRTSAPVAFARMDRRFGWVGWFALIMGTIVIMYYMVILSWSLLYMGKAATLDWGDDTSGHFLGSFLNASDGPGDIGGLNWHILSGLIVLWAVVYLIIFKGVKQVSKVVMITVPLPFLLLLIIAIRGLFLDGSSDGLRYFLEPDFHHLKNADVWLAAYGQIFFSLSLASGVMIAYSSYLPRESDTANNAHIVSLMNVGTSLLAGVAVFSIIGYLAYQQGEAVDTVVTEGGAGLAFIVYPTAINEMGAFAEIFGILFFLMLITLGIDSAFAFVEAFVTGLKDIGVDGKSALHATCLFIFLGGILFTSGSGLFWLDIIDHFLNNFGLITVGIMECIIVGHLIRIEEIVDHSNSTSEIKIGRKWIYCIKYVTPIILGAILFVKLTELADGYGTYPGWTLVVGASMLPISFVASQFLSWRMRVNGVVGEENNGYGLDRDGMENGPDREGGSDESGWRENRNGPGQESGRDGSDRDGNRDGTDRESGRDGSDRDGNRDGTDRESGRDGSDRDGNRNGTDRESREDVIWED